MRAVPLERPAWLYLLPELTVAYIGLSATEQRRIIEAEASGQVPNATASFFAQARRVDGQGVEGSAANRGGGALR